MAANPKPIRNAVKAFEKTHGKSLKKSLLDKKTVKGLVKEHRKKTISEKVKSMIHFRGEKLGSKMKKMIEKKKK